jgi:two-component system, OmpR family, sensor kinase
MADSMGRRAPLLLVVDDDRKLVPLLERGLRFEGFDVACAYSGDEALAATGSTAPDLVLLDVGLPDRDGFQVLRDLRRHSDVPVVMLTARDEVSDKVDALDLGADDYVAKPFAFDELMARVRAVLRRRGADQLLRDSLLTQIERDVAVRAEAFASGDVAPPYELDTFGAPDVFLQVTDGAGTPVARSGNLEGRTLPTPESARDGTVVEVHVADRPLFLTTAPLGDGQTVAVARSPITTYGALRRLRELLTVIVAVGVGLTALISWLYARTMVRPIANIATAAQKVRDSRDLSRRVPHRGPRDEVGRLVDTFNEMLAELDDTYRSLDASNTRMRQFLADCSHELRAPLARIRSTVDLLARSGDPDTDETGFRSRALADIASETDRMGRMVRQLLILARADAGATIEPRPVRLADVLDTVCRQAQRLADGVRLETPDIALIDERVDGDADLLEQLVLILVDNAFKYTPQPGTVRVTAVRDGDHARIDVADTGLGVPDEDADRIFERFYRGRNASAATGTGLGLAIAKWIAAQHNGSIAVTSSTGGGSRFIIRLPLRDSRR